jgi:hypothetical protein
MDERLLDNDRYLPLTQLKLRVVSNFVLLVVRLNASTMLVVSKTHPALLDVRRHTLFSERLISVGCTKGTTVAMPADTPPGFHVPEDDECVSTARIPYMHAIGREHVSKRPSGWQVFMLFKP